MRIRKRLRLPHWDSNGTCFVTFNLFDAMPRVMVERIKAERRFRIAELERFKGRATPAEIHAIDRIMRDRIDEVLDSGPGSCFLKDERVAEIVEAALLHFDGTRYDMRAWVVMPNHVHALFDPHENLDTTVHSWKSFTSKAANKLLGRAGEFWQDDYWDRTIRTEKELLRVHRYILNNPIKAGLKNWRFAGERASRPQSLGVSPGDDRR